MAFISTLDECYHRNALLVAKHGSIPSYAIWRKTDIENQTIDERISWWEESEKTPGQQSILQRLQYMKEHNITSESLERIITNMIEENANINNHLEKKETSESNCHIRENKETHSKKYDIVDEFCSKRYGNELYCDI
jgi:hypothetical protein